jgi:ADP-ribosylglycohydrolase
MTDTNYRVEARVVYTGEGRPVTYYDVVEVEFDETFTVGTAQGPGLFGPHTSVRALEAAADERVSEAFLHPSLWYDPTSDTLSPFALYNGLYSQYDRILGCLLGCALGDAIGAPVETKERFTCQAYAEDCILLGDYEGIRRDHHTFGQVTDDTQCIRLMAQSFDAEGYFSGEVFAEKLASWHVGPGLVGFGENTFLAIEDYLTSGKPWYECGRPHPACGNGAAMRAAILGVADARYGTMSSFISLVEQSCLATHHAPEAIFGAQVVAGLARELAKVEGAVKPVALTNRVLVSLYPKYGHLDMFQDWQALANIFKASPEDRQALVEDLAFGLQPPSHWGTGLSPYVRPSTIWAVYSFLAHPTDFTRAIATSVSCGGDVDTTAAMTGALFGCYNGTAMLDRGLLAQLHDRGEWVLKDYLYLAESLSQKARKVI